MSAFRVVVEEFIVDRAFEPEFAQPMPYSHADGGSDWSGDTLELLFGREHFKATPLAHEPGFRDEFVHVSFHSRHLGAGRAFGAWAARGRRRFRRRWCG